MGTYLVEKGREGHCLCCLFPLALAKSSWQIASKKWQIGGILEGRKTEEERGGGEGRKLSQALAAKWPEKMAPESLLMWWVVCWWYSKLNKLIVGPKNWIKLHQQQQHNNKWCAVRQIPPIPGSKLPILRTKKQTSLLIVRHFIARTYKLAINFKNNTYLLQICLLQIFSPNCGK